MTWKEEFGSIMKVFSLRVTYKEDPWFWNTMSDLIMQIKQLLGRNNWKVGVGKKGSTDATKLGIAQTTIEIEIWLSVFDRLRLTGAVAQTTSTSFWRSPSCPAHSLCRPRVFRPWMFGIARTEFFPHFMIRTIPKLFKSCVTWTGL